MGNSFVYFLLMRHLIGFTNELFQKSLPQKAMFRTSESSYYMNYYSKMINGTKLKQKTHKNKNTDQGINNWCKIVRLLQAAS